MQTDIERIIEHFGKENQCLKAIEEFSELSRALSRYLSCETDEGLITCKDGVIDELIDANIMISQLLVMFKNYVTPVEFFVKTDEKINKVLEKIENGT